MQIIQSPHEFLRLPARSVDFAGPKLEKIIEEMTQTLLSCRDPQGVGLAANQVGLPYCIFLAKFNSKKLEPASPVATQGGPVRVFINPEIVAHSEEFQPENKKGPLEGCLSVPKYYGQIKRWQWVKLKFQTLTHARPPLACVELELKEETFTGFPAVVIQHEMDHLDGKIFVERILEQGGKLYKQSLRPSAAKITGKDKKGKEKWEEVQI